MRVYVRFCLSVVFLISMLLPLRGQYGSSSARLSIGGGITTEYAWGESDSDIYYNEISPVRRDGSLFLREANLLGGLQLGNGFSAHTRVQLRRRFGRELRQVRVLQALLRWEREDRKVRVELGRFLSPFGGFSQRPLPQDRDLISAPLPYSYYLNISDRVGYSPDLQGLSVIMVDSIPDWGAPMAYPDGYATGLKAHWSPQPDTLEFTLALTQAAPISQRNRSMPLHPTLIGRVQAQPTYFWQQGLSVSYGGFLQQTSSNALLETLSSYRQFMLGTDVKLGTGYWELKGELMSAWHRVPVFLADSQEFVLRGNQAPWLHALAGYVDVKAEFPFLVGAYAIYRVGWISPTDSRVSLPGGDSWNSSVQRHTIGLGYQITRFLLFKTAYSWQFAADRAWEFDHWRSSLTLYF